MGEQSTHRNEPKLIRLTAHGLSTVKPTAVEQSEGLSKLQQCVPSWTATPALLVVKPHTALIVSVESVAHDSDGFTLTLAVREALETLLGFTATKPIEVGCAWNQPYMSIGPDAISAPYSFYLHFGVEGVNRARKVSSSWPHKDKDGEILLGRLRACFLPWATDSDS